MWCCTGCFRYSYNCKFIDFIMAIFHARYFYFCYFVDIFSFTKIEWEIPQPRYTIKTNDNFKCVLNVKLTKRVTYRNVYSTLLRKQVFPKLQRVAIGVFLGTTDAVDPYWLSAGEVWWPFNMAGKGLGSRTTNSLSTCQSKITLNQTSTTSLGLPVLYSSEISSTKLLVGCYGYLIYLDISYNILYKVHISVCKDSWEPEEVTSD